MLLLICFSRACREYTAELEPIDGMLLDILAAIARKNYGDRHRLCQAWFAPSCPGRRDPSPVTFSVVAGPFCARLIRSGAR